MFIIKAVNKSVANAPRWSATAIIQALRYPFPNSIPLSSPVRCPEHRPYHSGRPEEDEGQEWQIRERLFNWGILVVNLVFARYGRLEKITSRVEYQGRE